MLLYWSVIILEWWYSDRQNAWNVKPSVYVLCVMQERIREMFENLMQVEHPNIVKFHKYWLDMRESRARVSLKTHLIKTNASVNFALNSDIHVFFLFVPHRWFLSLNICHLEVSSSFWRRQRKTTKLWMWRWDVSSNIESENPSCRKAGGLHHLLAEIWQTLNTLVLSVCVSGMEALVHTDTFCTQVGHWEFNIISENHLQICCESWSV